MLHHLSRLSRSSVDDCDSRRTKSVCSAWPAYIEHKVFRFELYHRLICAVCTDPTGYRYADHPLPGDTIKPGVSPCRDDATPRLTAWTRRRLLPRARRGDASSSSAGTRHCLVFRRKKRWKMRHRLVLSRHRSPARQATLFLYF
ncbi:hypothetical protein BHE74_00011744 [Ensete ventricosum]|nr:hypothetical protein BHE74_00011744 [Ensete ventricosum]RZR81700.1 hypothetical protein BHM03_00007983 [Ensete ventricosum]